MDGEVRILLVEDDPVDAELIEREMQRSGITFAALRVENEQEFGSALKEFRPDLVLSDNALPSFDALSALEMTKQARPDAGFIVVSGTVGEERAVEMLKSGVTDYVLKHHLYRLGPVVERALSEADDRRAARAAEAAAALANERFRGAFEDAPTGMAVLALDGRLLQVNHALCDLLGRSDSELLRSSFTSLLHLLEQTNGDDLLQRLLVERGRSARVELRLRHLDGHAVWALVGISLLLDPSGSPVGFVSQFVDLMATKDAEARLRHDALYDRLTGLPNRSLIEDRLARAVAQSAYDPDQPVAVLFIDLDHFKVVNDSLGHAAGDVLLTAVAERLRAASGPDLTIGRFGGDQFVIVYDGSGDLPPPTVWAAILAEALEEPIWVTGKRITITASIGIAVSTGPDQSSQDLLRNAYAAADRAKELGPSRHVVFEETILARAVKRFNVEADLRTALDRGELIVHYQPQIDIKTGVLAGFEALVRWAHPEWGLIGPDEFIPVAEDSGLIIALGTWVLEQACAQAVMWSKESPDLVMSVNVSARQLADPSFLDIVSRVLQKSGVEPSTLCLEVTESVLLVASESMMLTLDALRKLGLLVSIDDFGTGYGSLSYLVQLRPDAIKIDKSFIQGLVEGPVNSAIVSAIVGLSQKLGLMVVAEGVETQEQLAVLQDLACDHAQGFLYARAMPADRASEVVADHGGPWDTTT